MFTFFPLVQLLLELCLLLLLRIDSLLFLLGPALSPVSPDGAAPLPQVSLDDGRAALGSLAKTLAGLVTHLQRKTRFKSLNIFFSKTIFLEYDNSMPNY
jgi:hypothetical protein